MSTERKAFKMLDYVEYRLNEWADWYSRGCYAGIGYPNKSTLALLREYQGVVIRMPGAKPLPTHEQAEEMEGLIKELVLQNERLASVLRENYLGVGTATRKAQKIGISYAHYKVQLDMGRQWLAGRLTRK